MKKLLAITLTVIMLMTALPLNGLAAISLRLPVITDITFESNDPIYYSLLKEEYEDLVEYAEDADEELTDEDYLVDICHMIEDYNITVELEGGETIVFGKGEDYYEGDNYYLVVYVLVDSRAFAGDYDATVKTVPLTLYARIETLLSEKESDRFESEIALEECYFREIRYISGLPEEIKEDMYDFDITDVKFEVTYCDGTKETLQVTEEEYDYYLGDKELYFYIDEESSAVIFECADADCAVDINIIYHNFEALYITSATYSATGELLDIEFELYEKDGSTESFSIYADDINLIPSEEDEYLKTAVLSGAFYGYDLIIDHYLYTDEENGSYYAQTDVYIKDTDIGDWIYDEYIVEEELNLLARLLLRIADFFQRIADFFRNLLS